MWDLIVSVPDPYLSFFFPFHLSAHVVNHLLCEK